MKLKTTTRTLIAVILLWAMSICLIFADVGNSFSGGGTSSGGGGFSSGGGGFSSSGSSGSSDGGTFIYISTGDPTTDFIVNGLIWAFIIGLPVDRTCFRDRERVSGSRAARMGKPESMSGRT